jgi:hypothetical protein
MTYLRTLASLCLLLACMVVPAFAQAPSVAEISANDTTQVDSLALLHTKLEQTQRTSIQKDQQILNYKKAASMNASLAQSRADSLRTLESFALRLRDQQKQTEQKLDTLQKENAEQKEATKVWKIRTLALFSSMLIVFGAGYGIGAGTLP